MVGMLSLVRRFVTSLRMLLYVPLIYYMINMYFYVVLRRQCMVDLTQCTIYDYALYFVTPCCDMSATIMDVIICGLHVMLWPHCHTSRVCVVVEIEAVPVVVQRHKAVRPTRSTDNHNGARPFVLLTRLTATSYSTLTLAKSYFPVATAIWSGVTSFSYVTLVRTRIGEYVKTSLA